MLSKKKQPQLLSESLIQIGKFKFTLLKSIIKKIETLNSDSTSETKITVEDLKLDTIINKINSNTISDDISPIEYQKLQNAIAFRMLINFITSKNAAKVGNITEAITEIIFNGYNVNNEFAFSNNFVFADIYVPNENTFYSVKYHDSDLQSQNIFFYKILDIIKDLIGRSFVTSKVHDNAIKSSINRQNKNLSGKKNSIYTTIDEIINHIKDEITNNLDTRNFSSSNDKSSPLMTTTEKNDSKEIIKIINDDLNTIKIGIQDINLDNTGTTVEEDIYTIEYYLDLIKDLVTKNTQNYPTKPPQPGQAATDNFNFGLTPYMYNNGNYKYSKDIVDKVCSLIRAYIKYILEIIEKIKNNVVSTIDNIPAHEQNDDQKEKRDFLEKLKNIIETYNFGIISGIVDNKNDILEIKKHGPSSFREIIQKIFTISNYNEFINNFFVQFYNYCHDSNLDSIKIGDKIYNRDISKFDINTVLKFNLGSDRKTPFRVKKTISIVIPTIEQINQVLSIFNKDGQEFKYHNILGSLQVGGSPFKNNSITGTTTNQNQIKNPLSNVAGSYATIATRLAIDLENFLISDKAYVQNKEQYRERLKLIKNIIDLQKLLYNTFKKDYETTDISIDNIEKLSTHIQNKESELDKLDGIADDNIVDLSKLNESTSRNIVNEKYNKIKQLNKLIELATKKKY